MKKLILPAEAKSVPPAATGTVSVMVDTELRLVVVADDCAGECLVRGKDSHGLSDVRHQSNEDCAWEHLAPDALADPAGERPAPAEKRDPAAGAAVSAAVASGGNEPQRQLPEFVPHIARAERP
jgi:hypothetical protein